MKRPRSRSAVAGAASSSSASEDAMGLPATPSGEAAPPPLSSSSVEEGEEPRSPSSAAPPRTPSSYQRRQRAGAPPPKSQGCRRVNVTRTRHYPPPSPPAVLAESDKPRTLGYGVGGPSDGPAHLSGHIDWSTVDLKHGFPGCIRINDELVQLPFPPCCLQFICNMQQNKRCRANFRRKGLQHLYQPLFVPDMMDPKEIGKRLHALYRAHVPHNGEPSAAASSWQLPISAPPGQRSTEGVHPYDGSPCSFRIAIHPPTFFQRSTGNDASQFLMQTLHGGPPDPARAVSSPVLLQDVTLYSCPILLLPSPETQRVTVQSGHTYRTVKFVGEHLCLTNHVAKAPLPPAPGVPQPPANEHSRHVQGGSLSSGRGRWKHWECAVPIVGSAPCSSAQHELDSDLLLGLAHYLRESAVHDISGYFGMDKEKRREYAAEARRMMCSIRPSQTVPTPPARPRSPSSPLLSPAAPPSRGTSPSSSPPSLPSAPRSRTRSPAWSSSSALSAAEQ